MKNCSPPPSLVPRALTTARTAMTSAVRSCRGQNGSTSHRLVAGVERLLEHVVERLGEHGGQGGDGRRADDPELDPAPQEPGHPAVALAQEDVVAAGPREQHRDLGEASAPSSASTPPSTQTRIARPNSGTFSATLRPFLKTPEPMTVPTTMAVAIHGPRTRRRDCGWVWLHEGR